MPGLQAGLSNHLFEKLLEAIKSCEIMEAFKEKFKEEARELIAELEHMVLKLKAIEPISPLSKKFS